jgi:prepilin signal peptidase PulO-like enzyme (type II secretory pathway)
MLPTFNYIFIALLIFFLISAIISGSIKTKRKIYNSFWLKFYDFALINLIIGIVFFFFNYQQVPFLSARFWLAIWAILIIIWLFYLIKKLKKIPKEKEKIKEKENFNKYLP